MKRFLESILNDDSDDKRSSCRQGYSRESQDTVAHQLSDKYRCCGNASIESQSPTKKIKKVTTYALLSSRGLCSDDSDDDVSPTLAPVVPQSRPKTKPKVIHRTEQEEEPSPCTYRVESKASINAQKCTTIDFSATGNESLHPSFPNRDVDACKPLLLSAVSESPEGDTVIADIIGRVPAAAARYLMPHQKTGVQWLWEKWSARQGCILG